MAAKLYTQIRTVNFDGVLREFTGKPDGPHYTIHEKIGFIASYTDWHVYYHVPGGPGQPNAGYYLGRGFTLAEARAIRDAHNADRLAEIERLYRELTTE